MELDQKQADLIMSKGTLLAVEEAIGRVVRVDAEVYIGLRAATANRSPPIPRRRGASKSERMAATYTR